MNSPSPVSPASPTPPARRKTWLILLALLFLLAGAITGGRWYLHGRTHVSTDNAYVAGNLIRITPRIGGTVTAVKTDNTQHVQQGQVLVQLDTTDATLALEQAEADLAGTVRRISQSFASRQQSRANLVLKQRTLTQAEADLQRRAQLVKRQLVSAEEAEQARTARDEASAALALARAELAAAEAEVAGTTIASHPAVKQAETRVRAAWATLARCTIRAPEAGQIEKRSVQAGQEVTPGMALMALVPMHQLWVEANFKEDQLRSMRVGQQVRLISDLYGKNVVFRGTVSGLSPGTGSVFSLLPAQNASGNWIKIVQRLPVRIELDPAELAAHPLRVGLSLEAEVDLESTGQLNDAIPVYSTPVFDNDLDGVDERIHQIIQSNQTLPD